MIRTRFPTVFHPRSPRPAQLSSRLERAFSSSASRSSGFLGPYPRGLCTAFVSFRRAFALRIVTSFVRVPFSTTLTLLAKGKLITRS